MWPEFSEEPVSSEKIEDLRRQLEDFYGTAMQQFPMAAADLAEVESMTDDEIILEAKKAGILPRL